MSPKVIDDGAVCVDRRTGLIVKVGDNEKVIEAYKDAEIIDAEGKLVCVTFF